MTKNQNNAQAVQAFLELLSQADTVVAGGPVLSSWETTEPTGEPDNELIRFSWEDNYHCFSVVLTEAGIASGKWKGNAFLCLDSEGDEVEITLFKQVAIAPPACKQCGSPLEDDYCSDETCVYHGWPQEVRRHDLQELTTDKIQAKYAVLKRVPSSD